MKKNIRQTSQPKSHDGKEMTIIAHKTSSRIRQHEKAMRKVLPDLRTLVRLISAYADGRYRDVPWSSIMAIIGALLYFLNPFDIVPDFFVGIGFVDDASLIALVVASVRSDLDRFRQWQRQQVGEK